MERTGPHSSGHQRGCDCCLEQILGDEYGWEHKRCYVEETLDDNGRHTLTDPENSRAWRKTCLRCRFPEEIRQRVAR